MGAVETIIISKKIKKDIMKELILMADNISSKIEVVSTETTEGEQFYNLAGIGALLRFSVQ
jgi:peptide chain release factor subunit 1